MLYNQIACCPPETYKSVAFATLALYVASLPSDKDGSIIQLTSGDTFVLRTGGNPTVVLDWLALGSSAAPALVIAENILYADFVTKINGSLLEAYKNYRITDFATVHYIVDYDGTQYNINTGAIESLLVLAISNNDISYEVYSEQYPQDKIHFDWNPLNWLGDLSFSNTGVIVDGFKGVIYFRHDTLLDNYTGYDFRNCKFRSWKTNTIAWNNSDSFSQSDFVNHLGFIWKSRIANNLNNEPAVSSDYWSQILSLTLTEYWNNSPAAMNGIASGLDYIDTLTFAEGIGSATYEMCCRSNHFDGFKDDNTYYDINATILSNNVFFLQNNDYYQIFRNKINAGNFGNRIGGVFKDNEIGSYFLKNHISEFTNNHISPKFTGNNIGRGFINNSTLGVFTNNNIGTDYYNNKINSYYSNNTTCDLHDGNTIGADYHNNHIGTSYRGNIVGDFHNNNVLGGIFVNNLIVSDFSYNIISNDCVNNVFYSSTTGNTIDSGFTLNIVESSKNINYTGATHVYNDYNKRIFKNSAGVYKLSYYNGSDVLTVVNPES